MPPKSVICIASDGTQHKFRSWAIGRDQEGKIVSMAAFAQPLEFESWMIDAIDKALRMRQKLGHLFESFMEQTED